MGGYRPVFELGDSNMDKVNEGRLDDLGLDSVLHYPDNRSWPDEKPPLEEDRAILKRAYEDLLAGHHEEAYGSLTMLSRVAFEKSPSYEMRWRFYQGIALYMRAENAEQTENRAICRHASAELKRAIHLAIHGDDVASQIIISRKLGDINHDMYQYDSANDEYLSALGLLLRDKPDSDLTCAHAEIRLRDLMARQQFVVGQFNNAYDNITIARQIRKAIGGPVMSQWDRVIEEWIEALILRGESQLCGGDIKMLRDAIQLFKQAEKRLASEPTRVDSLNRLYVQITETHMDLAERYRSDGNTPSYRVNMDQAEYYGIKASDAFRTSNDESGRELAKLALLRHDHLSLLAYNLAPRAYGVRKGTAASDLNEHDIAPRIFDLEQKAVEKNDLVLIGRAATLRADVLAHQAQNADALAVYYTAIAAFERAGARGEETRAVYGVRRVLDIV